MPRSDGKTHESSEPGNSATDATRPLRPGWRGVGPGVLLVAIAGLALYAGRDLPPGSGGGRIGPGPVPHILSAMLLGLGIIVAMEGFFRRRIGAPAPGSIVPVVVVAAAGAVFLLAVGTLGVAVATGLAVAIIAGYGLRRRPVAFVLVVVASIAAAVLLDMSKLLSGGA